MTLGTALGEGRSAEVFALDQDRYDKLLAAKLYLDQVPPDLVRVVSLARQRDLGRLRPSGDGPRYAPIAMPKARLFASVDGADPVGVAVLWVDPERFRSLKSFFGSTQVKDLRVATRFGLRLSETVAFLHEPPRHYIIGDLSETNVVVDAVGHVALLDADSFGVLDSEGQLLVRPSFVPPQSLPADVHHRGLTQQSDLFILARYVLRALFAGMDPFGGLLTINPDVDIQARINSARSWLTEPENFTVPGPWQRHPGLDVLPIDLLGLAVRAIGAHPDDRPTAEEWADSMRHAHDDLLTVGTCGHTMFRLCRCPDCDRPTTPKPLRWPKRAPMPVSLDDVERDPWSYTPPRPTPDPKTPVRSTPRLATTVSRKKLAKRQHRLSTTKVGCIGAITGWIVAILVWILLMRWLVELPDSYGWTQGVSFVVLSLVGLNAGAALASGRRSS